MYWLNIHILIGIIIGSYFIGTITGVYLSTVSVFGAFVWIVGAIVASVGGVFVAGRNWNKK